MAPQSFALDILHWPPNIPMRRLTELDGEGERGRFVVICYPGVWSIGGGKRSGKRGVVVNCRL